MWFTGGAVSHKSTQDVTKTFSQDSFEPGDDRECEMCAQEEISSDPDVEMGDFDAVEIGDLDELSLNDEDELGVIDEEKESGAEREEEIDYGYRTVDDSDEVECEDEPMNEGDADDDSEGINLGPEDGEEC